MLAAILRGKVAGNVEGLEDILTSVVFGVVERLPPDIGVVPLLRRAVGVPVPPWLDQVTSVEAVYWPWWEDGERRDGCEPDVALTLGLNNGARRLIVVEAKRGSSKSGTGERDQLARQVDNAVAVSGNAILTAVLYVTTDVAPPMDEIAASRAEIEADGHEIPIWWFSWRSTRALLDAAAMTLRQRTDDPKHPVASLAADAAKCLRRWGLSGYEGVRAIPTMPVYRYGGVDAG